MSSVEDTFGFSDVDQSQSDLPPGSGVGVVRILKRDYAVGLQWNGVEQPAKAAAEARQLVATHYKDANFFCIKLGGTPQIGLGFKAQGHRAGMPSLAAHVAMAKGGSWIGLFEVPEGYYLVAVRDEGILSECDLFFNDADAARDTFERFQNQSDWTEAIAPEDFGIPGTTPGKIEDLLLGRPSVRLRDVSRSSNLIKVALGASVIGGLILGVMFYLDSVEEERQWEIAQELARQAQNVVSPQEEEIVIPPMPWESQPLGTHVLRACFESIQKFPLDIPGWEVKEFFCEGRTAAAAVDRAGPLGEGGGSINWVKLQVEKEGFAPSVIPPAEGSGQRVSVQWALEGVPNIPVDLDTAPVAKMKAAMLAAMEERFTAVTFSQADSNDFWQGFTFRFTTSENPLGFLDVLGALPGVILDRIRYDLEQNEWTLEGRAYEQLPLPQKQPAG